MKTIPCNHPALDFLDGARRTGGVAQDELLARAYCALPAGPAKRYTDLAATAIERGYAAEADGLLAQAIAACRAEPEEKSPKRAAR